jgi:hypothetical protein
MTLRSRFLMTTAILACLFGGCHSPPSYSEAGAVGPAQPDTRSSEPPVLLATAPPNNRGNAQLWSQTCNRCHNPRSPDSYNANEWAIVMTHMRIRGYLTGQEQRAILDFLQSQ